MAGQRRRGAQVVESQSQTVQDTPRKAMSFGSNRERQRRVRWNQIRVTSTSFEEKGLRGKVLEKGLTAFRKAFITGETDSMVFTIIDFELSSKENRLWVINLQTGQLLHNERVTHGRNSDKDYDGMVDGPSGLSNTDSSYKSNIGLLKTAELHVWQFLSPL